MEIIAFGKRVILRDRLPSDVDSWIRWMEHGEWRDYDAPWELSRIAITEERREKNRKDFLQTFSEELPSPRTRAIIAIKENNPIGGVSCYSEERFPDARWIGIDICENNYLNQGLGTEALQLWIDYVFSNSQIHRLGLRTYSFNKRMMRVAEKACFKYEGVDREIIQWQNQWLDRVHYGMLRREWEERNWSDNK